MTKDNTKLLSDEENLIYQQIKGFRENPKKFLEKKQLVKKRKHKEYEEFINSLEKMPELIPDKDLCDLAKEEMKTISEDNNYNKYQIGEDFKLKLNEKFSPKNNSLIAIDEIKDIEEIIPKIIINEEDVNKKGRQSIINPKYSYVGISQLKIKEGKLLILIFF